MRPYEIAMMEERTTMEMVRWPDVYEVRKHRWKWITWLRTWLMKNVAGEAKQPSYKVTRKLIYPDKIIAKIMEQQHEHFRHNRRPSDLLIGGVDYAQMMNEPEIQQMMCINTEYHMGHGAGFGYDVCGLKVHVVPWMQGVLVLPDGMLINGANNRRL